ncbi:cytochrome-c peroxidase [Marinibaculum pumilum]|uniref:Cytochrome-c peroxidase n=1 Tax=Marinibaculum pumilum TaxID=1766165 RepID=A0ABV7KZF4_9PROT
MTAAGALLALLLLAWPLGLLAGDETGEDPFAAFDAEARALILSHGPWPPAAGVDPGNRLSGDSAAIALGEHLFGLRSLSRDGLFSCADCHDPASGFDDGRAVGAARPQPGAAGPPVLDRNTPGLWDARFQRWFGWGGATDSLWAASLRAMTAPREMAATAAEIRAALAADRQAADGFAALFDATPAALPAEEAMVLSAKAIAAYLETLVSPRTPFDEFRDALARGDRVAGRAYPAAARRGLALFVGAGRCSLCHFGPTFSNGEFADIGMPFFLPGGGVDRGRYGGIQELRASPYSLAGRFNDDAAGRSAWATEGVVLEHRNFGEFQVPSLRGLGATAPYMHDGSLPDLESVVRHYSDLDMERLHADGEAILRPLHLSDGQIADLVAFLRTLEPAGEAPLAD